MNEIAVAIRDWLPSVAVLIAGAWILIQWLHTERLRRNKDRAALDGILTTVITSIDEEKSLITVDAQWNNRSPLPFVVDVAKTLIDIFQVTSKIDYGPIDMRAREFPLGQPLYSLKPYERLVSLVIEPNTENKLQTYFLLRSGSAYLVRWRLVRKTTEKNVFLRNRYSIVDLTRGCSEHTIEPTVATGE